MQNKMWGILSLSLISTVFLVTIEFPPNPEDGEFWLPSDVFHEIESCDDAEDDSPAKSGSSSAHGEAAAADEISAQDPLGHVVGLNGPEGETGTSSKNSEEITGIEEKTVEDYDSARKSVPANNHKGGTDEKRPCGGTGVFLPRHNRRLSMDADLKLMAAPHVSYGGTGVFINPQFHRPAAHRRTKSCVVNVQFNGDDKSESGTTGSSDGNSHKEKMAAGGKPTSVVKSDDRAIHLPEEWIY